LGDQPNFAYFLSAPLVIDTDNFRENLRNIRWIQEDFEAYEWLASKADVG